jgi:hypothetical protein
MQSHSGPDLRTRSRSSSEESSASRSSGHWRDTAWRLYLGLPMSGTRPPEGNLEAFFRLGYEDAVLLEFEPIVLRAVAEFPAALNDLRE